MGFLVFIIAWLVLLVLFISPRGEPERNPITAPLGWLCIAVIFGCALYTMATSSFMAGAGMIGSLTFFTVNKEKTVND